jgi:DNA-binding transcriptional LysR family regulator
MQLARHGCLVQVTPAGTTVRWQLRRGGDDQMIEVRGPMRSNAPIALRDLAIEGAGIAYLPDWLVADDIEQGRLRRVLPEWASPPLMAWAVYRTELRRSPRLRVFLDVLSTAAARASIESASTPPGAASDDEPAPAHGV